MMIRVQDGASTQTGPLGGPERLVGLGFRYWLKGFRTGDIFTVGDNVRLVNTAEMAAAITERL